MKGDRRGAQLIRTLRLIAALDAGWISVGELAEQFSVTRRTIRRDVRFLQGHGFVLARRGLQHDGRGRGGRMGDCCWKLSAWPARYDLTKAMASPPLKVQASA